MYGQYAWREYEAAPLNVRYANAVSTVKFDDQHEVLWSGCSSGAVYNEHTPSLEPYSRWQAHASGSPVLDMLLVHGCCLSISHEQAVLSACGGAPRLTYVDKATGLTSCCWEPGQAQARALLGRDNGGAASLDLATGRVTAAGDIAAGDAVVFIRGPVGRGMAVAGLASGAVVLADPRCRLKAQSTVVAHAGGLAHVDANMDTVATCGYAVRMGQLVTDTFVKVFDVRFALRPLLTLPFAVGPSSLCFHPTFASTLLVMSSSGLFSFADIGVGAAVQTYQVETGGDALACCAISSSGEAVAFGGSGGYLHLWTDQEVPKANRQSEPLERPLACASPPAVPLSETDYFSRAQQYVLSSGSRLLSDVDLSLPMHVGLPPRVVDPALLKDLKQVDFVGYLVNPQYSRGKGPGEPSRQVAHLRNQRVHMKSDRPDQEAVRAERARKRLEQGGVVLPMRYHPVEIKVQSSIRFEEFDFSYYNRTQFAGLENGLPNCYCNALLQLLYFTPAFHDMIPGTQARAGC